MAQFIVAILDGTDYLCLLSVFVSMHIRTPVMLIVIAHEISTTIKTMT
jgi:hypothetical protein